MTSLQTFVLPVSSLVLPCYSTLPVIQINLCVALCYFNKVIIVRAQTHFETDILKTNTGGVFLVFNCYDIFAEMKIHDLKWRIVFSEFLLFYHGKKAHSFIRSGLLLCSVSNRTPLCSADSTMSGLIVESASVGQIVVFPSTLIEIQWRVVWLS